MRMRQSYCSHFANLLTQDSPMPTILIVEDDVDLSYLYQTTLSEKANEMVAAKSYGEVMDLLRKEDFVPDLVILDIGMPDAPGTRIIEYMREQPRFEATRILVITANDHYKERVENLGVNSFLVKPISIAYLVEVVDELMGQG